MTKQQLEQRSCAALELREDEATGTVAVAGLAVPYGVETVIADSFREKFMPGAFRQSLADDDVMLVVTHRDAWGGLPIARTGSGTLELDEQERGVDLRTDLDGTDPDVQKLVPKMRRKDVGGLSIGFVATRQEWDDTGDMPLRIVHEAMLDHVAVVANPAYSGAEVALRCRDQALAEIRQHNFHAARKRRMRMTLALTKQKRGQAEENGTQDG